MISNLDHPLFSDSEDEWYPITDLGDFGDNTLAAIIVEHQDEIVEYCTRVLQTFIKEELVGTGTLAADEILVQPMGNATGGFVAYADFKFPSASQCDSDSWWMIVGCPDTTRTTFPSVRFNAWSFGWFCQ